MSISFQRLMSYRLPMMAGADVEAAQRRLAAHGFGTIEDVDGLYGPGTRDLVKAFQRRKGLLVDGKIGRDTATALNAAPAAAPAAGGTARLRPEWLPPCTMKRVILHWTGGGHRPSNNDRSHYHFLIDGDGGVHRGNHSVRDNVSAADRRYAAHTRGTNTGSIGVAVCAMAGASERPFRAGAAPMTEKQWQSMAEVTAELCRAYDLPCRPDVVLAHGEVEAILGRRQAGKWDPLVLPWDPGLDKNVVGQLFRDRVMAALAGAAEDEGEEALPEETVMLDGAPLDATRFDAHHWIDLADLASARGWDAPDVEDGICRIGDPPVLFQVTEAADARDRVRPWVDIAEVSEVLGLEVVTGDDGQVALRAPATPAAPTGEPAPRPIVVSRGDTLGRIAARHLGDPARWREITMADGRSFDDAAARSLRVGQVVLLPPSAPETPPASTANAVPLDDEKVKAVAESVAAMAPAWLSDRRRSTVRNSAAAILRGCTRLGVGDPSHVGYILATADHETNLGINMIEIWRDTAAQRSYAHRLGNRGVSDAKRYCGRGFVQLTGRSNYARYGRLMNLPLEDQPRLVEDPDTAADILVKGMTEHGFTSPNRLLSTYGFDGDFDFFNARGIINGDKHKTTDQRYAGKPIGTGVAEKAMSYRRLVLEA